MPRYTRPDVTALRPVGVDGVVDRAQAFAAGFRLEIRARAISLRRQVVNATSRVLHALAACTSANPSHGGGASSTIGGCARNSACRSAALLMSALLITSS